MKSITKLLAAVMAAAICAMSFASCGGNTTTTTESQADNASTVSSDSGSDADYSSVDFSDVALTIKDSTEMNAYLDSWDSGKYDNKVIKISGENSKGVSSFSVMQKNKNGEGRGCTWEIIDGKFPDDYPKDGAEIEITGVLEVGEYGARVLKVPADKVVVK